MVIDTLALWDSLGSGWEAFQSKTTIENFWYAMASGIDTLDTFLIDVQKSRTLQYMTPLLDVGPIVYTLVYSGTSSELNVTALASGGLFYYPVDSWTYSIPELLVSYKYRNITYSGTYTENTHYTISGLNYVVWGNTAPTADARYSTKSVLVAYAPHVYRINPVLMEAWARFCGFTYSALASYNKFGQNQFKHLKMLIWALVYKQLKGPSIKTLRDSYGIARGLPFAYESGLLSSAVVGDHYEVTVPPDTYVFPSGLNPIVNGNVSKFDIICSGFNLWDYVTNPTLVTQLSTSYNKRNLLIYELSAPVSGLSYSSSFFNAYVADILPVQLTALTI